LTVRDHSRAAGFDNAGPSFTLLGVKSQAGALLPCPRSSDRSDARSLVRTVTGADGANSGLPRLLLALAD